MISSQRIKEGFIFDVESTIFAVSQTQDNKLDYKGIICFTSTMRITEDDFHLFCNPMKPISQSHTGSIIEELIKSVFEFDECKIRTLYEFTEYLESKPELESLPSSLNICNDYIEYRCQYLDTSQLDFNDNKDNLCYTNNISKKDWTERSLISKKKMDETNTPNNILCNEFILTENDLESTYPDLPSEIPYDIALLLGMTRSRLFNPEVSTRIYNILLPLGRFNQPELSANKESLSYLIIPFLTLHKSPNTSHFHRLISTNLWIIPQKQESYNKFKPAEIKSKKINELTKRKVFGEDGNPEKFSLDGPLKKFLTDLKLETEKLTIDDLLLTISTTIYKKITGSIPDKNHIYTQTKLSTELLFSFNTTIEDCHLLTLINEKSIKDIPLPLQDDLQKWLSTISLNIKDSMAQDRIRYDAHHLFLYSVDFHNSILLLDNKRELFPKAYSAIKWGTPGIVFLSQAISTLRIIFYSFHRESEKKKRLSKLSWIWRSNDLEKKLIEDLQEYYLLDIEARYYKEYFEKVKKITGLEKDYEILRTNYVH